MKMIKISQARWRDEIENLRDKNRIFLKFKIFSLPCKDSKNKESRKNLKQTQTYCILVEIFYYRFNSSYCPFSEKAMAPHPSTLAWKIPWMEEPGRLQSMGLLLVGHDWVTASLFTFMHWRRTWQPTPVFLNGESQGRGSLVGCRPWGRTELDTTEVT